MKGGFQPYAKNAGRTPTDALMAMLKGTTLYGDNPADVSRGTAKLARGARMTARPPRRVRPSRMQRAPR